MTQTKTTATCAAAAGRLRARSRGRHAAGAAQPAAALGGATVLAKMESLNPAAA